MPRQPQFRNDNGDLERVAVSFLLFLFLRILQTVTQRKSMKTKKQKMMEEKQEAMKLRSTSRRRLSGPRLIDRHGSLRSAGERSQCLHGCLAGVFGYL